MKAIGIIPARYASSRFPGKPLAMIGKKTMLQRVYERCRFSNLDEVLIATDDQRIEKHAQDMGAKVIMTSPNIKNGTRRCAAAYKKLDKKFDVVINIQGDEPFIDPTQINKLVDSFKSKKVQISTLSEKFTKAEELENPNNIKIVVDKNHFALYFSRSVVPFLRDVKKEQWVEKHDFIRHIGIYAFRSDILMELIKLRPVPLEVLESLEQLNWLFNGYKIKVLETKYHGVSVDTPEDLEHANFILNTVYE